MVEGEEYGLHHVFDINKGDVLTLEAYGEVDVVADGFRHHEVVFLPRAIDARGSENDVWKIVAYGLEEPFGLELALAVSSIGAGVVVLGYLLIGLLFADGSHHAERTEINKAVDGHLQVEYRLDQPLGSLGVDLIERVLVEALRGSGGMDDVVEGMGA